MLNEREIKILELFIQKKEISLLELANKFNLSDRMIRYNIENINNLLKILNAPSITKYSPGIFSLEDNENLYKILNIVNKSEQLDKNKRDYIILSELLFTDINITIRYIIEKYNVTRSTAIKSINDIKKELGKYSLELLRNNELHIIGNNSNIKKLKLKLIKENIDNMFNTKDETEYILNIQRIYNYTIDKDTAIELYELTKILVNKFTLNMSNEDFKIFFANIYNVILNKKIGKENNEPTIDDRTIIESQEYKEIVKIINNSKLKKLLSKQDKILITDYIIGVKSYDNYNEYYNSWVDIELIVKNIIKIIEVEINEELSKDNLLFQYLFQHLKPLIYRAQMGNKLDTRIINELDREKDEIYRAIMKSLDMLSKIIKKNIPEEEAFLLKLHVLSSIDRIKKFYSEPDEILVVSSLGSGSKKILKDNIQNRFFVKIIDIVPAYMIEEKLEKNKNIKYILSTTKKNYESINGIPVIKIEPILTDDNKKIMEKYGIKINTKKIMLSELLETINKYTKVEQDYELNQELLEKFGNKIINDLDNINIIDDLIIKENILFDYETNSIENAVLKSCELLEKSYIDKDYTESIMEIYKNHNEYIIRYDGILLPHAKNNNNVRKSGISIISLKNKIKVENSDDYIDTIITFSIKDEKKDLDTISRIINNVFNSKIKEMIKNKDIKELVKTLNNFI